MCSAPAAFRNCARRIARPLFGRPGQGEKLTQADYGSAIAAGVRPTRHEISRRVFATIPAGRLRAAAACGPAPHVALGWAKWPRAARAGGGGAVPGRRPAINCQKFTALWLFKPSSESEPYPPRQKTRQLSRGKQRGILGRLSAAVADRPDGWRGRAKPAGRNRARVSRTAGPRSSVGLLGAGTSPQPGLAGINRGPGRELPGGDRRSCTAFSVRALPRWPPGHGGSRRSRRVADARRPYFTGSRGSTRMTKF